MRAIVKPSRVITRPAVQLTPETNTDISIRDAPYPGEKSHENVIFWGTPVAATTSIIQRIRTFFWFYPDHLARLIHRLRPLSYLILYSGLLFLGMRTFAYADKNTDSFFGTPPAQNLIEGTVGSISTLNPLYVTHNQLDRDLQALLFNRLVGIGTDGNLVPELASSWAISDEGTTYMFFLRDDIHWHDGENFTAEDVVYTFETIQKLEDEDSYTAEFEGISFSAIDEYTVLVTLPEVNPTLMDSLSFPILPSHLLKEIQPNAIRYASYNDYPIGTGPFKIVSNTGESVKLVRNSKYFKGMPKLKSIEFKFFATEEDAITALKQFKIHTIIQASDEITDELKGYDAYNIFQFTTMLRQKVVYINLRNSGPLESADVRHALSTATDRDTLISRIPSGGVAAYGTIPSTSWAYTEPSDRYTYDGARAQELLTQAGWTLAEQEGISSSIRTKDGTQLSLTLTYLESPTNTLIAEELQEQWATVGISLVLDPQSYERISSETVPRRNFDLLLFEVEYTSDPDRYNIWHSTKADYPGLNLSGYSNNRVDIMLERGRTTLNKDSRKNDYSIIERALMNDMPSIFLYYPSFTFIANNHVNGIELEGATLPQERYNNVEDWYITRTRLGWRNWQTR